ncbi:ornithine cyclodeaminase family protein [Streptomyces phaeoluteigriseus]|uniref:Ornithine cyclodeaminase family protein n=1 Tax=Streptomyces phaeoluteigriseus TaxID=114686 RepID=A0ABY4Z973_9ACTN|nr:ornithine cyclodeaminase family protein [Streptomyces phaeoluteigriseus]USQ85412.1 ornithine cyclodeaminase family protein [Streptomyces phaeoluteigriseus]
MLLLGRSQVEALLDVDALIDVLAPAMADLSAGRASVPDRVAALVPERDAFLAAMPGFLPSAGVLMTKLVSLFPHNDGARPTHQALIVAFDPDTGEPAALLDGTAITAARTGACSALSARLLAREDATVLAVLGTGVQARSHARALCRVRPIRQVRIAGRDPAKAAALAEELSAVLEGDVRAVSSYAEALDGADIAAATTHAVEPVIRRAWLTPGVHVTSVGYNPAGREIDDATVIEALVCVESRQAVLAPPPAGSNDLLMPIRDGLITADHVHAELGEIIAGSRSGRTTPGQITLYKSVGVAAQDAAATALVVAAAREQSIGEEITMR